MNDEPTPGAPQGTGSPDPLDDTQRVDVPRYAPTPDPRPDARWAWAAPGSQPPGGDRWYQPAATERPVGGAPSARPAWSSTGTPPPAYNAPVQAPEPSTSKRRAGAGVGTVVTASILSAMLAAGGTVVVREQTGALRVGYTTTSEQLAHQIHWLLLRFGIVSTVRDYDPTQKRPSIVNGRRIQSKRRVFEVRVAGMENVVAFSEAVPMWGPRGVALTQAIPEAMQGRRRGSQATYLAAETASAVLNYLAERGVTAQEAAAMIGASSGNPRGGMKQVLGAGRLRRDRVQVLADALDDKFLHDVLAEELRYSVIREVLPTRRVRTFDLEVDELHNLVAEGVVVHNCSPPFKQAEFDILYGKGISKEGSLIDMGVEQGFIRKSGSWFTYEGEQLGQGKENARNFLLENTDVANEVEKKIKEKLGIGAVVTDDEVLPAPVDF